WAGLAERALMLLWPVHGPDLMLTDDHPGSPVPYPVVVLQNALAKMLALPVEVSYTLPEALERLGSGFRYQRKDHLHYPLGHGLRSEAVYSAWHQGRADLLDQLRQEGRLYLFALRALLASLRQHVRDELFAWPPKFQLAPAGRHRGPAAVAAGVLQPLREPAALPRPARGPAGAAGRPVPARPDAGADGRQRPRVRGARGAAAGGGGGHVPILAAGARQRRGSPGAA